MSERTERSYRISSDPSVIIENLPPAIKELIINQRNIDFFPQYGKHYLKDDSSYHIEFDIPYKEPPIVVVFPLRRNAPETTKKVFKIEPIKVNIEPPTIGSIAGVKVSIPAIIPDKITLPKVTIPEIAGFTIDTIEAITKTVKVQLDQIITKFVEITKSALDFPDLPKISAWSVDWALMEAPGVFGESLIGVGSVGAVPPPPDPDSGESSITTGGGESFGTTAIGSFGVEVTGPGSSEELTPAETLEAIEQAKAELDAGAVPPPPVVYQEPEPDVVVRQPSSAPPTIMEDQPGGILGKERTVLGDKKDVSSLTPVAPIKGKLTAKRKQYLGLNTSLGIIHGQNKENVDITTDPSRKPGQFTGAFNFDFRDQVFGGFKKRIGFRATAVVVVPDPIDIFFTIGGSEGFRLWLNGVTIVDSWYNKKVIDTTLVKKRLEPGTYSLAYDWYVWDNYPACFFSTVPPFIPQIGRMEFDLENAMEMAYVSAWFFIRDNLNALLKAYLPIWEIIIPEIWFPYLKIFDGVTFTVSIPKLKAVGKTIYGGKTWILTIPRLEIPRFRIIGTTNLTLDVAAPFIALNNATFNLLSIFPRWFGRFSGKQLGSYISSGVNAALDVARGAFDSMKGMGQSIINYVNASISGVEKNVNKTIKDLTTSLNTNINKVVTDLSAATEKVVNEAISHGTETINTVSTLLTQKVTKALGISSEQTLEAVQQQITDSLSAIVTEINTNLNKVAGDILEATNLSVNAAFKETISKIDTKINALNIKTTATMNTALNGAMTNLTNKVNFVLNAILPEIMEAMGLNPNTAITQANLVSSTATGFVAEGLKGGVTINWLAIGQPDLKSITSSAIDLVDI